ncbi:response regulator [Xanthomonas hortorum]|uniref:response regulator n=1 Tax=Xanthomonas hortorum TaxID=56454 RepID=UPI0015945408|nr:response regulator [Xanthomonas hortorum]
MDNFRVRILLVEDDLAAIDAASLVLKGSQVAVTITVANSRNDAIAFIEKEFFDFIVLDLTIPTSSGELDAAPQHGRAVFGQARAVAPGTPVCLLTGSSVENFTDELLASAHQMDIWGGGTVASVKLHRKFQLDTFINSISPYLEGFARLSNVELEVAGEPFDIEVDRLLRIFASMHNCVRCKASRLTGGLSGSAVLRIAIYNEAGAPVHEAVAKVASIAEVRKERDKYNGFVQRLPPGITPRLLATYEFGGKATGAVFYGLAAGHIYDFFKLSAVLPDVCEAAVKETSKGLAAWVQGSRETRRSVADVRRTLLSDDKAEAIVNAFSLDWVDDFERRMVQVNWGCVHNDFHGANVLLDSDGRPAVIDYAEAREGPASIDPVTLELSAMFHPDSPWIDNEWPKDKDAEDWGDLDKYLEDCPYPTFVRACRLWADSLAIGKREIATSAYSYLLRQFKYDGTNKKRAAALIIGARRLLEST